jgi:iron complex outermembrane receptor protein
MQRAIFLTSTALFSAAIGLASPAIAADAPAAGASSDSGAGDIVVTARKREERAIDVPISLQAFSAAQLKASGITDLQTLKDHSGFQLPPVLSTQAAGRFTGVIIFRGLQASAFGDSTRDNSGSLFVDGIYISGGPQSVNTADVERVEVLKGPQSTYFGRSTFGGAVNFITRNPSDKFGGEVNITATARGSVDGDLSIEGPIASGLTARITAYTHNKVAQYQATDGGDIGAEKTQGISGTLYFKPTENFFVRVRGNYQRDEDSAGEIALLSGNTYAAGACTGKFFPGFNERTGAPIAIQSPPRNYFCNGLPTLGQVGTGVITTTTHLPTPFAQSLTTGGIVFSAAPSAANLTPTTKQVFTYDQAPSISHSGLRRDALRLSGQIGYTFESGGSIAFNAGYNKQESVSVFDIDRTDRAEGAAAFTAYLNALSLISRDLTLDGRVLSNPNKPLRFVVGASYFSQKIQQGGIQHTYQQNYATIPTVLAAYPNGYETENTGAYVNLRASVPAIYASIEYDIMPSLTVTAEGRYQWDKTTSYQASGLVYEKTFASFLPRAVVRFHPGKDLSIYASYSRGVQPAGINTAYAALNTDQQNYVQSIVPGTGVFSLLPKLDAFEFGVKQRLFDGKLDYSIAIYQNNWDNAVSTAAIFNPATCFNTVPQTQLTTACPLLTSGTAVSFPNNARIRGVEFSATARPTAGLTIDLTVDYKDAIWTRYSTTAFNSFLFPTGAVAGDRYRGDGNKLARVPALSGSLGANFTGNLSDDWSYYIHPELVYVGKAWDSDLNLFQTSAYTRANLRLGFKRGENLTVELYSTNLFNDKTWDYAGITVELQGSFADRAVLALPAQKREIGLRTQFKF